MIQAKDIPNSAIQQLDTSSTRIWYRVGTSIHVTVGKDSQDRFRCTCHTCRTTDECAHAKAVKRFITVP